MKKLITIVGVLLFILPNLQGQERGLISYWSFDELAEDRFSDHTDYRMHGQNLGGTLIPGVRGSALYFDGSGSHAIIADRGLEAPRALGNLGEGSISLWFRVDSIPMLNGIAPIFYYGNATKCEFFDAANEGLIIEVGHAPIHFASQRVYFTIWANGCTYPSFCFDSTYPILQGKWYHLVVVVGEDYNTGYLNGLEMISRKYNFGNASYSEFFKDAPNPERLWLGKGHWDREDKFLKGAIDELRIYNRPLDFVDVQALFADATSLTPTDLAEAQISPLELKVYPNPSRDEIRYHSTLTDRSYSYLEIFDAQGKLVEQRSIQGEQGSVGISQLDPGSYYFIFGHAEGRDQVQVMVQ